MPVAIPVRNLSHTKVVHSTTTKGEAVEWGPAGSKDGSDVQEIHEDLWASARIRRAAARGLLALDTTEGLEAAYAAQRAAIASNLSERDDAISKALQEGSHGKAIVISASDMEAHVKAMASHQDSEVLATITDAATNGVPGPVDPMAVINGLV
jgi:hypothetical protein